MTDIASQQAIVASFVRREFPWNNETFSPHVRMACEGNDRAARASCRHARENYLQEQNVELVSKKRKLPYLRTGLYSHGRLFPGLQSGLYTQLLRMNLLASLAVRMTEEGCTAIRSTPYVSASADPYIRTYVLSSTEGTAKNRCARCGGLYSSRRCGVQLSPVSTGKPRLILPPLFFLFPPRFHSFSSGTSLQFMDCFRKAAR